MTDKQPRSHKQAQYDEIFGMMERAIRLNEYGPDDLLQMVGGLVLTGPVLAQAISMHAADFIRDSQDEVTWTDIVVEAYRRALFDSEKSPLYGTGYFVGNLDAMRAFVTDYITGQTMGDNEVPTAVVKTHVCQ